MIRLLNAASEMYVYLSIFGGICQNPNNLPWRKYYADFPPRYILQTLADLSKIQVEEKEKIDVPGKLIERLESVFHFEF